MGEDKKDTPADGPDPGVISDKRLFPARRLFDSVPCYASVQGPDFRILDANRAFKEAFGDHVGEFCYEAYKQRSSKCPVCSVEKTFADGLLHNSEETACTQKGETIHMLVQASPIRDEDGNIAAVMEMSTDITEIKHMQKQLQESQDRYRSLFEEVPCYISIQDSNLSLLETNRAFQEDFGGRRGGKCYEVYKHRTEECFPCPVRQTFQDGKPHHREEVVTSLAGRQMNVLVSTTPILDAEGRITGVMEMSANITQVRELQSQLASLGLLVGSISHGLKGLLNGLTGGMYLLDSGIEKEDRQRIRNGCEMVQRNLARIRNMVSDILYYAKERDPKWEEISAVELAKEVCGLMEKRAASQGVELVCSCEPAAGTIEADRSAVRSMLVNILENSIDACRVDENRSGHRVQCRLEGFEREVLFEIEDNGIGMDRETRENAFSLFFSSKGMEGTGLGLFIANRIAQAHGGGIEVTSQLGVGTRFVVKLPRTRSAD